MVPLGGGGTTGNASMEIQVMLTFHVVSKAHVLRLGPQCGSVGGTFKR